MDRTTWIEFLRMLLATGAVIVSADFSTLTVTLRVPPTRATHDDWVEEWVR